MEINDISQLYEIVEKDQISTNKLDLICYSADLAPLPDSLLKSYGMLGPEVVVRPRNVKEISEIVAFAHQRDIPVTPRGAGTTATGGVLPMEGGIVLDLCSLNNILELNEEDEYVRVETGLEFQRLIDWLEARGWQLGSYPSSAPSATIGGYLGAGAGAGVGITKYGNIGDQIISLKVVLADGRVVQTGPGGESWIFIGSEGTLGVIGEVILRVFKKSERKFFMFGFNSLFAGIDAVIKLVKLRPYFISFLDKGFVTFLNEVGASRLPREELTVPLVIEGSEQELERDEKKVDEICSAATRYREKLAIEEWHHRFKVGMSFKSLGPSVFVQELRVPLVKLVAVLRELKDMLAEERWGIESLASDNNSIVLVVYMLADERNKAEYFRKFAYVREFGNLELKYNGTPFGIGLHNTSLMPKIHTAEAFQVMKSLRNSLDPKNILNPSKTTQIRVPGLMAAGSMKMMGVVPEAVEFGLESFSYMPRSLSRLGLKLMGGKLR
jgi:glycolate oxidase